MAAEHLRANEVAYEKDYREQLERGPPRQDSANARQQGR